MELGLPGTRLMKSKMGILMTRIVSSVLLSLNSMKNQRILKTLSLSMMRNKVLKILMTLVRS